MKAPALLLLLCCLSATAQPPQHGNALPPLDARHLLLDGSLSDAQADSLPFVFNTLQEAVEHLADTTTLYIRPWVYWVDNPDTPDVVTGRDGREPLGMVITTTKLTLTGLTDDARRVVLASQRGQMQGAVGNFTMFDFHVDELTVENMTLGNYCNVDLDYPWQPALSRQRRSDAITQAHVGYVHGRQLTARNVRFISRLNLNPLNGARHSTYDSCHFECTDDALNGGDALYRHCTFHLYGQKPWWSTFGAGPLLVDCDFHVMGSNREMFFCKQGGPLTLVGCRYHAPSDSIYIGWTAYPQPWLRCYQHDFTLNGRSYLIGDRQPQNTIVLHDAGGMTAPPYLRISRQQAELRTGEAPLALSSSDAQPVRWRVDSGCEDLVSLKPQGKDSVLIVPTNQGSTTATFCVVAATADGREAACQLTVHPRLLPPPTFLRQPVLQQRKGVLQLMYGLDLQGRTDESVVTWLRDDIPVSVMRACTPGTGHPAYRLTDADNGHRLSALIVPRLHGGTAGDTLRIDAPKPIKGQKRLTQIDTDFSDLPTLWQPRIAEGYWTADGYKPADTQDYSWSFNRQRPMWAYEEGFNGAVGYGLVQAQRGARLMYTPVGRRQGYGDMELTLLVDPTKTAGQGFGSATGQYMDVCLKFDPLTLTGYGLRIIRTTKHARAVDFLLVEYDHGQVHPLTDPVSATCYRTGCTIALSLRGGLLTAHVSTITPRPADSALPHEVSLQAPVAGNAFGGIHIQHTGSCGESTTMLHHLTASWEE